MQHQNILPGTLVLSQGFDPVSEIILYWVQNPDWDNIGGPDVMIHIFFAFWLRMVIPNFDRIIIYLLIHNDFWTCLSKTI